jgi:cysteine-rich repeat protein
VGGDAQGGAGSGQAGVGGDAQGGAGSGQAGAGGDAQGGAGQAGGGGAVAVCGDGVVDAGEECDDGNVDDTDGCVAGCLNATCGDGFVRTGVEACDDGNQDNADGCTNACALPSCGDGFLQAGEVCDDGNADNTDACTDKCQAAACGDGFLQAGEACDDGNQDSTDGCTTTCQLPACGDGFVQAGEACDDGNQVNTDACLDSCVKARCGDMIVQAGVEECDDGNLADADGCSNACLVNFCGNGVIDPGEQCDGANLNNQTCATATGDPKDIGVIKCQTDCLLDTSDCKEPCVTQSAQATLKKKPVDIIFVIDNSGSMTQEIQGVQNNINASFASIIGASGLDYRIIMFSKHGSATADQSICITSPLSGAATCTPPPAKPVFSSTFFQYSVEVASTNSLALLITDYTKADTSGLAPKGWSDFLRPTAFKIFVEITDDNQSATYTAATFDKALLALSPAQFGTAAKRNYLWHSIVGVKENAPATKPYQPGDALVATKCSTAVNPGTVYQNLSIMTGGLRFPLCNISSYDAVFQQIATGIVEGSAIECAFPIPMPANTNIDPATVEIEYTPGNGGPKQTFSQVPDLASCQPGKIYIANNIVNLCPATCTSVQADTKAAMSVLYGCKLIQ